MSIDEQIDQRIRDVVRDELKAHRSAKTELLFTPAELASRWKYKDAQEIARLVKAGHLRCVRLSERKMVFTVQEIRRFEESGGVKVAA
jgi:hypothetical protein